MQPLDKSLRNRLERTVKDARDIAETAASAALQQLGVSEAAPSAYLSEAERELRRRLRIHGRQLGDIRNARGVQEIDRLLEEVAYEHWHRMLFARFLAENNLLMYPDPVDPVAVTLEECEDLASEEGAQNGWELASRFAARMLPQIFRPNSPVIQLLLPPEHQLRLERLVADLSTAVFTASDSLGWVYQFWQAKKKDEINASEVKIGARELAAVTQLFTEPYMVNFLLDNALGAWWVGKLSRHDDPAAPELRPGAREILRTSETEEELRVFFSLPSVPLEYLRFVRGKDSMWRPAAGWYEGWPQDLGELKVLDPCCGSGHFLVAIFLMLVAMRMELEGLSAHNAVDAVLRQNIHGLEIDQRCVEIAAFALALTAWCYPGVTGYRQLPELNLACSGLSISTQKDEWFTLAGDNTNLGIALEELYKQFRDAPVLGSLINPESSLGKGSLYEIRWEEVGPLLTKALSDERDVEKTELGVVAQGLIRAATLMVDKYQLVVTNVPYLGREGHDLALIEYADRYMPKASGDLATLMLERIFEYTRSNGYCCMVLPQNWWVGRSYSKCREEVIKQRTWLYSVVLGEEAWETFGNRGPNTILVGYSSSAPGPGNHFAAIDVSSKPNEPIVSRDQKIKYLRDDTFTSIFLVSQTSQLNNPSFRISLHPVEASQVLSEFVMSGEGSSTGDADKFIRCYWEVLWDKAWISYMSPDGDSQPWGGRELLMRWENGTGELARSNQARIQNTEMWNLTGVLVGRVRGISTTLFDGGAFSKGGVLICPKKKEDLGKIYNFLKSAVYEGQVRALDPRVSASTSVLTKVNFEPDAIDNYDIPKKFSADPTQWIFHGNPANSKEPLQVAIARLLGYRWPAEIDTKMELADEAQTWVASCGLLLMHADPDGIVCIPSVRGEASASDRLLNLLADAYGDRWGNDLLSRLLVAADHKDKSLESWLREKFFTQHCKLFQHRPFIWHIWDGLSDGFAVLVNYNRLDAKLLETLIYTYLGDWISRQRRDIAVGVDGAEEKLAAAEVLKKRLELIREGEAPYDIFVRWKPVDQQPIGWEPDLNDGVRLNIRPFLSVQDVGKKGAGVLRDKPNIKWDKDRGKDVESAPWYHLGLQYGGNEGDRINDHHLTLAEKRAARAAASEKV